MYRLPTTVICVLLFSLFVGSDATLLKPSRKMTGAVLGVCILFSRCTLAVSDDEYFGDTQSSVGSINFNPFASSTDIEESRSRVQLKLTEMKTFPRAGEDVTDLDSLLNLIPSWKYYKVIANEYSKRSSAYKGPDDISTLLMPFM